MPIVSAGAMKAGDATFHNGWTLHGAPGNASPNTTREVMTIIYLEDGARISQPDHANRENDLRRQVSLPPVSAWRPSRARDQPARLLTGRLMLANAAPTVTKPRSGYEPRSASANWTCPPGASANCAVPMMR
jgi:ectoine hydroxylase-related dioxygenase (phytanoyl-CoA dioxygenase family)